MSKKYSIVESLKVAEDNFHGYTVFLLGIGIVFLFLTLIRFMLGIMTCLNLIFNGSRKKALEKVKDAKKGTSKEGGSKKKKRRSSKTSSKSSKSKTSKISTKSAATKAKKEEKNRGKSTSPKGKPKPTAATKKEETSKTDSSLAKKGKSWILEKRKSISDTLTSNSSSVKATSVDLLAAPKKPSTASTTTATKSVTFDNVPEPASNTAYKYASVATTWQTPIAQDTSGKLFKSDDCPTPNPFKDPNSPIATTPPYVLGAPKDKTPKTTGNENSGSSAAAPADPTAPAPIAAAAPPNILPHDYPLYAPHEVPVQFRTENVKTAVESSSYSPGNKNQPLKTPTKKEQSETVVVQIPSPLSPAAAAFPLQTTPLTTSETQTQFSVQATPLTTSDTQSQFSLQLTPQTTSDTQKSSSTADSPAAPKTAEEKKKV